MALIECKQCGQHVSDKASSCMHCGTAVNEIQQALGNASIRQGLNEQFRATGRKPVIENPFPNKYDPHVIYSFSNKLYEHALRLMVVACITGAIVGGIFGYSLGQTVLASMGGGTWFFLLALLGGLLGYLSVQSMVFLLRLVAQLALCFVQIEQNTGR